MRSPDTGLLKGVSVRSGGRVSIRFSLATLVSFCVVVAAFLTLVLVFSAARDSARMLLVQVMRELNQNLRSQASLYLNQAGRALETVRTLHDAGGFEESGRRALDRFLVTLMENNPQFADVFVASRDGQYIGLKRMPDGSLSVRSVRREAGRVLTRWNHAAAAWTASFPDADEPVSSGYDPRTRPWYRAAVESKGLAWSDVYFFSTTRRPGVTCSLPIYGDDTATPRFVVGINIGLEAFSHFLGTKLRDRIFVVILDDARRVVALPLAPGDEMPVSNDGTATGGDEPGLPRLEESGKADLVAMLMSLEGADPLEEATAGAREFIGEFETAGEPHLGLRYSLAGETPWNWTVHVMVPEGIYMDAVQDRIIAAVLASLLLIALALALGLVLSRRIAEPMKRLAADMARVEHFDLDGDHGVTSQIREIDGIAKAFDRMKTGLRSFRKYVPADLVKSLVRLGQEADLGGERREMTVYFSDIAGFTTISERMDPEQLVHHLSAYFSDLGTVFRENRGTIDKYIGDAIMAFWNAPERAENHAELGCRTALQVQARLAVLNSRWRSEGRPELGTRCGLSTGEVIVGNMGSEDRLNYTVIGDTANLASRLEGLNKYYGTRIMLSESTWERVKESFRARRLDYVAVKGKTKPVAVYELLAEGRILPPEEERFVAVYEEALSLHVARRWTDAIRKLDEALRLRPDDLASRGLRERCEDCITSPPPPDWNGSHVMESK